jgi:hypothetical protein
MIEMSKYSQNPPEWYEWTGFGWFGYLLFENRAGGHIEVPVSADAGMLKKNHFHFDHQSDIERTRGYCIVGYFTKNPSEEFGKKRN